MNCVGRIQAFTTLTELCHLEDPVVFSGLTKAEKQTIISSIYECYGMHELLHKMTSETYLLQDFITDTDLPSLVQMKMQILLL